MPQTYLPEGYENRVYYRPSDQGHEAKLKARHIRRYGTAHPKTKE